MAVPDDPEKMITTERVAVVMWELMSGNMLSTAQIADLCGISFTGAWLMMSKISRVRPIYQQDGLWVVARIN